MNLKRQSIFFWLSRIAVLLIYFPFFAVQCFFNYSSITQTRNYNSPTAYTKPVSNPKAQVVATQKKQTENRTTVSLNKRFEPAIVLSCVTFSFEIPACFFETRSFGSITNSLIQSFLPGTGTLRGPPSVA